jgi:hypothetical protein
MYQISIDYPNMPKGQEVSIPGLGTYKNGSTTVVSNEEANAFRAYQVDVGMPDQTLLQSFVGSEYVTVETYTPPKNDDKKKDGDQ